MTPIDANFSCVSGLRLFAGLLAGLARLLTVLLVGLTVGVGVKAAEQAQDVVLPEITNPQAIRLPADFSQVDYYLITVDVGNKVWDNFGHTALRVVDRNSNSDLIFNWGLFDTSVGSVTFASNFFRGILQYQLGVSPPAWEFGRYEREQRTIWQDRLNLTTAQKAALYRRLAWNLREENIVYSYQYFFDNCTTRVRDYLDEALGGRLREQSQAPTPRSFRDEVRSHYATLPPIALSLDILMNSRIDRPMTLWESMFLPATLRDRLLKFPSDVFDGAQRRPLLDDSEVLQQFTPPAPGPQAYPLVGVGLGGAVLFLFLGMRRIPLSTFSSQTGFTLRVPALSYRLMGTVALLFSLLGGSLGLIMSVAWWESAHLDLHHNLNLLLFWPTDLLGLAYVLRWLVFGRACQFDAGKLTGIKLYLLLHLLAALVYVGVALTGLVAQEVISLLLFVVPAMIGFLIVLWNAGFHLNRRIRFN